MSQHDEIVADIVSEGDARALLATLYDEVCAQKRARRMIHLCISGGRKTMTLYAMLVAQWLAAQRRQMDDRERARCEQVLAKLTEREREVLRAFAAGAPQAVAERLSVTLETVDSHKTQILAECRVAWNLPESSWLDYHFLHDKFGRYFDHAG